VEKRLTNKQTDTRETLMGTTGDQGKKEEGEKSSVIPRGVGANRAWTEKNGRTLHA